MPVCSKCGEDRPLADFGVATNRRSGHQAYCKACMRARVAAFQKLRRRDPDYCRSEVDRQNRRYKTDPDFRDRKIARTAARHAFNRGDIPWAPCPCGSRDSEMHHEDYSKPLEVKWLCRRCHMLEHYGPAPVVVDRPKTSEDPIADLLRKLDARKAAAARAIIGPAKAGSGRARRVA